MNNANVAIVIGDPWEFGEAIGWIKPTGKLTIVNDADGVVDLDEGIDYNKCRYVSFDVHPRYVAQSLLNIPDDGLACYFVSKGLDLALSFTGALRRA